MCAALAGGCCHGGIHRQPIPAANIGILAGLVMVILQMNQASEFLAHQLLRAEADSFIAAEHAYVGEDFALVWQKHLEEPENLTLARESSFRPAERCIQNPTRYTPIYCLNCPSKSTMHFDQRPFFGRVQLKI